MAKTVCFTLDVEPDFAGLLLSDVYFGKRDLPKLEDIVRKYDLKITAFATGKTLEDNPDILESLRTMRSEIEQHSYSHQVGHGSKINDIKKGLESYEKIFGHTPKGYRSPQGIIRQEEVEFLQSNGVLYDSSIFPAFFPGRYNRVKFPTIPYLVKGSDILEIPFGVIPRIRIPIGLSFMQLLGINTFKLLSKIFGLPDLIVYDFHTYELGRVASYQELPLSGKIGYFRAQKLYEDPINVFEEFVKLMISKGYQSKYMIEVYKEIQPKAPIWEWKED